MNVSKAIRAAVMSWRRSKTPEHSCGPVEAPTETGGAPDDFLHLCRGVLHVGANLGQERQTYAKFGLPVVWFEALPAIFDELTTNLAPFADQHAVRALLTDREGAEYKFKISNNGAASSSILDFKEHSDIWPEVFYVDEISLKSSTIDVVLGTLDVDTSAFDVLVMDTQGSELLVLQGAVRTLERMRYVKTEAADFEAYENCATVDTISEYLSARGFQLIRKDAFADHPVRGRYYDLLFERV